MGRLVEKEGEDVMTGDDLEAAVATGGVTGAGGRKAVGAAVVAEVRDVTIGETVNADRSTVPKGPLMCSLTESL